MILHDSDQAFIYKLAKLYNVNINKLVYVTQLYLVYNLFT